MSLASDIARAGVWHDAQGLGGLKRAAREDQGAALQEAARQFESVFVGQMLDAMRKTVPDDGMFSSGEEKQWQGMLDRQMSMELTRGSGFGLADAIVRQLGGSVAGASPAPSTDAPALPTHRRTDALESGDPATFIRQVRPHAEQAARRLGVDPDVLVAQAALETGWGASVSRGGDGRSSNNLFNIKAGAGWQGETVTVDTLEYRDGAMRRERAGFRAYPDAGAAFDDYVALLESPRYARARAVADDPRAFVRALADAGYATDPAYAEKVIAVLERSIPDQGTARGADTESMGSRSAVTAAVDGRAPGSTAT